MCVPVFWVMTTLKEMNIVTVELRQNYNKVLENLAVELDISPSKYQQAVQRYTSVGNWIADGEYDGVQGELHIYTQGSFRLGTVVRPLKEGAESDYDIDLVCEIPLKKSSTTPASLKKSIGERIKENAMYQKMLDKEKKRCWTLNYAEQDGIGFHLDILPSVPESVDLIADLIGHGIPGDIAKKSISITNRERENVYSWSSSNPNGYAEWFETIKRPVFEKMKIVQKQYIFENNKAIFNQIDEVPDQLVKTPLQRAIQILKRHRDVRFAGHEWEADKPISMIITTLSARAYQHEMDLYSTIKNIVEKLSTLEQLLNPGIKFSGDISMLQLINRNKDGYWIIPNPVNPAENFADRWHEKGNRKAKAFFQWITWVKEDLVDILQLSDVGKITKTLEQRFGERIVSKATQGVWLSMSEIAAANAGIPHIDIDNPSKPWSY